MNRTLTKITSQAIDNAYDLMINDPTSHSAEGIKELDAFRDRIREQLNIIDFYLFYMFLEHTCLLIAKFNTPNIVTSEKIKTLLDILELHDYNKIMIDNELYYVFDVGAWY
jgi:hypothetical protein